MSDLSTSSAITISFATPEDVPAIVQLIHALADYEKLTHEVTGNAVDLTEHLFGDHAHIETLIARVDDVAVGFALFFHNYSTFLMKPGIYLEDLFVVPEYRGRGSGKLLLQRLGQLALERDCGRLEWNVLDWNQPAIDFYERMGAEIKPEWQLCRVTGRALTELASR